ncbi:TetR/AcrR family transcriptional regulator [Psychromarinibacter halotolerans]|uniref:TetR/AcrR family transcriptional regulator n=1 Tax=Psychromarinibacter halotolerans TaxID=1775175 RepID=A0ABV7GMP6_9RHOB|nr:TetR/AcrR family transcriptional regulator [Psychromarinibacter halotolerans]MAQ81808.1 TetR family transcriptional regulator [Maritimibacter sp.]MDF0596010.1 TetR/AcrR family transcriptional regulator [Psychromarinibacter halotolerans]
MTAGTGAIKQGRKFDQVVEGAREIFLSAGFEGASVDDIARAAQVSKATLYSYFPDKRRLFMEVAQRECQRQAEAAIARIQMAGPASDVLYEAATEMTGFFLSEFGRQTYRIAVSEAERFPELGRAFFASGPTQARNALVSYLGDRIDAGELEIDDVAFAAEQFIELCKAGLHIEWVMGIREEFTQDEVSRVIRGAVEMFLARYGRR